MRLRLVPWLAVVACGSAAPTTAPPSAPPPPPAPSPPAPSPAPPVAAAKPTEDLQAFTLHKFLAEVGAERDVYMTYADGTLEARAVFSYKDRFQTVPLAASYAFAPDGTLLRYAAWGATSRFAAVDERAERRADGSYDFRKSGEASRVIRPAAHAVAVPSYAPMLGQELMLRAWQKLGRPAKLALIPDGELAIEARGKETYDRPAGKVTLEHVAIRGLVWGREDAWLDDAGKLVAVVTRDTEFDHHEAARQGFEPLLPELAAATGKDGVAWLEASAKSGERGTGVVALVGGTLIDGTGKPAIPDAVVVTDGDRIVAAGPKAKVAIPAGATTLDVTGASIVPGLWDMHAHVEQVEQGAVYLAAGVTSVRDMGNILEFITGMRDAIAAGKGLGPRILVDGLVDGDGEGALGTIRIKKRADIAPVIDRLKKAGCLEVKTYSSIDPALVPAIVAYAHGHGMRVVGHLPGDLTAQQAVDAGYDAISHLPALFAAARDKGAPRPRSRAEWFEQIAKMDFTRPAMQKLIADLARRRVVIDDTVALYDQLFYTHEEAAKREPGIATLPRELATGIGTLPAADAPAAARAFARYLELIGLLHKRGVTLVAGTDIAVPGHSVHRELELYVEAGFTPMEAIQAATLAPARHMRLDKELGTIEPGKRADLVVVRGNPLARISDLRNTQLVVARGRVYDTRTLWELVGFKPAVGNSLPGKPTAAP
jgi:imidazolonepropionase-like amidohydrolase